MYFILAVTLGVCTWFRTTQTMHMQWPVNQLLHSVLVFTFSSSCLPTNCSCCSLCELLSSRKTLELSWKSTLHPYCPSCCTVAWTISPSTIIRSLQCINTRLLGPIAVHSVSGGLLSPMFSSLYVCMCLCLSVGHIGKSCKNRQIDWYAV